VLAGPAPEMCERRGPIPRLTTVRASFLIGQHPSGTARVLCGQNTQRGETSRSPHSAGRKIRVGHQPQDRKGNRRRSVNGDPAPRRRGDRVTHRAFISWDSCTLHVLRCSEVSPPTDAMGHSRLRWSRPRLVHVRFNSDSDRQPSKRDPALRAKIGHRLSSFDHHYWLGLSWACARIIRGTV
jgi:hypothetical protein